MKDPSVIGTVVLLLTVAAGCAPGPIPSRTTPPALGQLDRSRIIGRIQLYKSGKPLRVGPAKRPLVGWLEGERALTTLSFRNVDTGGAFAIDITAQDGRFEAMLPPGRYGVGLRYAIYRSDTPARFDVPEAGRQFYIGTLQVNFLARASIGGTWAATAGGIVPEDDSQFAVIDEGNETAGPPASRLAIDAGTVEKRLMRVTTREHARARECRLLNSVRNMGDTLI